MSLVHRISAPSSLGPVSPLFGVCLAVQGCRKAVNVAAGDPTQHHFGIFSGGRSILAKALMPKAPFRASAKHEGLLPRLVGWRMVGRSRGVRPYWMCWLQDAFTH